MTDLILEGKGLRTDSSALRSGESPANDADERPACLDGAYSGGMSSCEVLMAACDDPRLTATEFRVLANIAKGKSKRSEIALAAGCSESTVPRAVRKLIGEGYLDRECFDGRANKYVLRTPDTRITSDTPHADDTRITADTYEPLRVADRNDPKIRVGVSPLIPVSAPPKYIYKTPLEVYPETPELEAAAVAPPLLTLPANSDAPPPPAWQRVADAVRSPWLDPNKSVSLVTGGAVVQRLIQAGCDEELDIVPTVKRLCERRGSRVTSWNYFTEAIRQATAERKAAEADQPEIQIFEPAHVQPRSVHADGIRHGKISPASAILLRKMSGGH